MCLCVCVRGEKRRQIRLIYWLADIGLSQLYLYQCLCCLICTDMNNFFLFNAQENAWGKVLVWNAISEMVRVM